MEIEELKNRWSSLEEQLKKQEILSEKLVQEVRQNRTGPLGKMIRYGYFGISLTSAILVAMVGFCIWKFHVYNYVDAVLIIALLLAVISIFIGVYNIKQLRKIDFTQSVSRNIQRVHTYRVNFKRQLLIMYLVVTIFVVAVIFLVLRNSHMQPWQWWVIGVSLTTGIIWGYWEYKKMFEANTREILKTLEELKELEE